MGLITKEIAKGVNLRYLKTDKFKCGYMSVNFIAPLSDKTAAKNALIGQILVRGSKKYPNMAELNKALDYLYDSEISTRNMKRGEMQIFGLTASMLSEAYTLNGENLPDMVCEVLEDLLLNPITEKDAFSTAYTESEKSNLIDEINSKINNKTYYAKLRCIQEMCKNEAFGISETGTVEEVSACTPKSVYEQYKYALLSYPVEIFFVGNCDIESISRRFEKIFSKFDRSPIAIPKTEIIRSCVTPKWVNEDMEVKQGKLVLGFRSGVCLTDEDYYGMMLFNELFGGGVTSKLFMNVREKMSLCYYCSSAPDATKGLITVSSGIEVENRQVAEKAILEQLDALKKGDFTEDEYLSAKLGIINSYRELSDSARLLETWYLGRLLMGIVCSPEDVVAAIENVCREDAVKAANKVSLDTVYFLNGTLKGDNANA